MVIKNVGAMDAGIRALLGVALLSVSASLNDRPLLAVGAGLIAPGSKFPACFFRFPTGFLPARSAFGSTTSAGSPQPRLFQRQRPVAGSPPLSTDLPERLRSPSRPFTASRDQCV
jgi:hypothetical protein